MQRQRILGVVLALALLWLLGVQLTRAAEPSVQANVSVQYAAPLGSAFTYQGQLRQGGNPINGTCDFRFGLWDAPAGGAAVGSPLDKLAASLASGLFSVPDLDFGGTAFTGDSRWLEVAVRCPAGSGSYTTLTPRQALTAAPYALYAKNVPLAGSGSASTAARSDHNHWGQSWTSGSSSAGLSVTNSGTGSGLSGTSYAGYGVAGDSAGTYGGFFTGLNGGVYGEAARTTTGPAYGVYGKAYSTGNIGVYGENAAPAGGLASGIGVLGKSGGGTGVEGTSTGGVGVAGSSYANYGVMGDSASTYGGYFTGQTGGVYGKSLGAGPGGYFDSAGGKALEADGDVQVTGNLTVTGQISGFPHPNFDSGWVDVAQGATVTVTHNLGGDPENYVVDMTFRDYVAGSGIHQITYGGDVRPTEGSKGVWWEVLTATSIKVIRGVNDVRCQAVRIRIWVYK
jgi:hypothetical protein